MCVFVDEASDLEVCKLLATNAKNLNRVISETLYHTHSACVRIGKATRKELGLSKIETVSGMLSQVSIIALIAIIALDLSHKSLSRLPQCMYAPEGVFED